jgi:cysteine-rich repeat protein
MKLNLMNRFALIAVCGAALTSACSGEQQLAGNNNGGDKADDLSNLSLNVTGSDTAGNEYSITTVDITITDALGNVDAQIADFDVSGPGSTIDVALTLEEGEDYVITATGTGSGNVDTDGNGTPDPVSTPCTGTVTFDIVDDVSTPVSITLLCAVPGEDVATGEAEVDAEFVWERNPECGITSVLAGPLTVGLVGGLVNLASAATPGTVFAWSVEAADLGTFVNPAAANTKFDCATAGSGTLTLTVTNEAELCEDSVDIDVTCTSAFVCGDNVVNPGEQCDGTATPPGQQCTVNGEPGGGCRLVVCGNGITNGTEACDDGNTVSGDGCNATCSAIEECGDGIVQATLGELCDPPGSAVPGAPGVLCEADCTFEVPTCAACTASSCATELAACTAGANGTKCTDLMACFDGPGAGSPSDCAFGAVDSIGIVSPCFCGTFSALDCAGGDADGACLAQARLAASATATPTNVLNTLVRWDDPTFAVGDAKNLALCQIASCNPSCEQF